ncbi:restriction endonuclease subunit S [Alteromonas sp. ASW11-130]|uniref:restriction endonuclease subunit S n=1 Tax=Alteromonas sp. ASW11-130 TaxID=3015775 RepID=UPI002242A08F|nr:restriction endonuclease subunit S [Alteromonas sp. ASW11-130]MCW8091565.1 restriction endonuclease subunit S [Alteromonas sp. ASW11-130]
MLDAKEFPSYWKVVPIADVVFFQEGPGVRKHQYKDVGVKLLNGGNINNGILNLGTTDRHISSDEAEGKYNHFLVDEGDLLIACSGVVVEKFNGKIAYAKAEHLPLCMNTSTMRFKALDAQVLYLDYFRRFLETNFFKKQLQKLITGSAQLNFGPSHIKLMNMPLPPLDEQKRIAAILDKADSVRRKRQQAIDLADDFLRSVFLDMFGDPVTNPKGWEVKKFGTVIDVLTDYHANGSYKSLNENVTLLDEPNYAYMVRTTDLEKKNYTDNVKYIDQHAYEHLSKTKVYGGELVINKIGSAGAVYLMPYLHRPVSLAMNQFMIRCNEHCLNEFVYYQLKTNAGARELEKRVQGAVTKTITKDAVRDIPIILPPIELQRQFIDVVEKINKLKTNTDNSSDLIRAKFNSISQKAFAGEL